MLLLLKMVSKSTERYATTSAEGAVLGPGGQVMSRNGHRLIGHHLASCPPALMACHLPGFFAVPLRLPFSLFSCFSGSVLVLPESLPPQFWVALQSSRRFRHLSFLHQLRPLLYIRISPTKAAI